MIDESIADPDPPARRELLEALALAFRDNPMNVAIHGPQPKRRVRANREGLRGLVLDAREQTVARVIRHQGRVVGGFVAVPPGGFPLSSPGLGRQIRCFLVQGPRAMAEWREVTDLLGQYHPVQDHWYLAVLGVVPWLQGHGFGSRLLDELDRTVECLPSRPVYLESDREQSMRFYLARGFSLLEETLLQDVRCWCLGRGFLGADGDLCDSVREP